MVVITLKSLSKSYEHFVETLNITSTGVDLKSVDLCTKLLQQDWWKQQFGSSHSSSSSEQAFMAKSFQKDKGKSSQPSQQKTYTSSSEGLKKKNVQCNYSHKYGHMKLECRKRLVAWAKQSGSQLKANVAEHTKQSGSSFYAFMDKRPANHVKSSAWYIDSGASRHFTHHRDWFTNFQPYSDSVIFGGGEEYTVVGKGNVQIRTRGRKLIFLDVYYVPGMELNLLSINQILTHSPWLDVTFSSLQCSIIDRETQTTVVVGREDYGLFKLVDSGDSRELAMAAKCSSVSTLWHQRYGHLNVHCLSQLVREDLVIGLLEIWIQNLGVSGSCQPRKQHRTPFSDGNSWRAFKVLQLVHADICGPMAAPSVTRSRYFLFFVDDFSRKMWVDFLHQKSEVIVCFQKSKALVENESGQHIVTLQSDNRGEFCSSAFSHFCEQHGIKRQLATP